MEDISKLYSLFPPDLMRPDSDQGGKEYTDINDMPIGMAYVPRQVWRDVYTKDKALMRGTLFAELDKPFKMGADRK